MTAARYATPEDFARWEERARAMPDADLIWSIRDCGAAERAMRRHDAIAEGRYADERMTYEQELAARRRGVR